MAFTQSGRLILSSLIHNKPVLFFTVVGFVFGFALLKSSLISSAKMQPLPPPPFPNFEIIGLETGWYDASIIVESEDMLFFLNRDRPDDPYYWQFVENEEIKIDQLQSPHETKETCLTRRSDVAPDFFEKMEFCYSIQTEGEWCPGPMMTFALENRGFGKINWWLLEETEHCRLIAGPTLLFIMMFGTLTGYLFDISVNKKKD